ncbi:excalibur calcium-binding domain-containing protein [Phyllobacterium sp. UNC302MFCol5.2]|uniref:excalibur calcium-binding domain-containing protein n=1 Tax=Phyllobacterium sp. UNC302MFCol5.2 TaxID=1449065 RepID=UPI0012DC90AC
MWTDKRYQHGIGVSRAARHGRNVSHNLSRLRYSWYRYRTGLFFLIGVSFLIGPMVIGMITSPWPIGVTIRHYAARANCDAARTVGLAPARRGQPGYWDNLDADNDGKSCEPFNRGWGKK